MGGDCWEFYFVTLLSAKKSALKDDSDDDGLPNTYDYQDSFIDDDGGVLGTGRMM